MSSSSDPLFRTRLTCAPWRDSDLDTGTVALAFAPPSRPFEALFLAHYRAIRELARSSRPGVGVVAVSTLDLSLAGRAWVARRADRPNVLCLGRHSRCDLLLSASSVSLRHVAVVVPPVGRWPGAFGVHDLRTGHGLETMGGAPLPAAQVDRAGAFGLGPYALFAFATGPDETWPELATDAWPRFGHPVVTMEAESKGRVMLDASAPSVTAIHGPMLTSERLLAAGEPRAGVLSIRTRTGHRRVALGPRALERGLLLGRYPRCHLALSSESISRVHALVLQVGADVVALDTSSTCGVFDEATGRRQRVVALSRGEVAVLAEGEAEVALD